MSAIQTLARIFPPPRFMTLPAAGVDISDASLKYVQFRRGMHGLALERWGDLPIPAETVKRGDVLNRSALVEILKRFKAETDATYIRVSLPEERAYLFDTTIPVKTAPKDVRSAIEFHLDENVPLSPRDAFFDYTVLGKAKDGPENLHVSVAVYARDTIMSYYESCREAGLIPVGFEVEAQAVARAVIPEGDQGTYLIVDFGESRTGVGVVHKGALMLTSTIDVGGIHLTEAIKRQIPDVDAATELRLKNEFGLLRAEEHKDVHTALLAPVATLKDEVAMRINYWNLRDEGVADRTISKVILCGGSANLAGLPEYLSEELGIKAERAHVWQNAFAFEDEVPQITRRHSYGYVTAVGLALADFMHQA